MEVLNLSEKARGLSLNEIGRCSGLSLQNVKRALKGQAGEPIVKRVNATVDFLKDPELIHSGIGLPYKKKNGGTRVRSFDIQY